MRNPRSAADRLEHQEYCFLALLLLGVRVGRGRRRRSRRGALGLRLWRRRHDLASTGILGLKRRRRRGAALVALERAQALDVALVLIKALGEYVAAGAV